MLGSVVKRERRSLWATVSLLLALGIVGCAFLAGSERRSATEAAQEEALPDVLDASDAGASGEQGAAGQAPHEVAADEAITI